MKRYITLILIAIAAAVGAEAASPSFEELSIKAGRFIHYREWASAQAMLQLMVEERPDDSAITGRAIAVAGLVGNSNEQLRLFRAAVDHRQRFDSVFSAVETESFSLACVHVYEDFLKMIAREEPWTERSINSYLLRYYTFRRDGAGMVEYAGKMLAGMPDNVDFLHARADGYMLEGEFDKAAEVLQQILVTDPRNLKALLELGFYRESQGNMAEARDYLSRACAINPTPYLRNWLGQEAGRD